MQTVDFTSPRLRGEVGLPRRCEASSGAIRVRGPLDKVGLVDKPPHPALRDSRSFASAFFSRTVAEGDLCSPRTRGEVKSTVGIAST
jgi:hypothetical protein